MTFLGLFSIHVFILINSENNSFYSNIVLLKSYIINKLLYYLNVIMVQCYLTIIVPSSLLLNHIQLYYSYYVFMLLTTFLKPRQTITVMCIPVSMILNNEFPYRNIMDDSLSDELLPENNLHEGQTLTLDIVLTLTI